MPRIAASGFHRYCQAVPMYMTLVCSMFSKSDSSVANGSLSERV
jgi:hypothetical protein